VRGEKPSATDAAGDHIAVYVRRKDRPVVRGFQYSLQIFPDLWAFLKVWRLYSLEAIKTAALSMPLISSPVIVSDRPLSK